MYSQVGSGYTYKELLDFNLKLKDKWQRQQPSAIKVTKEKPDVWIEPEKSTILQVRIAGVLLEYYWSHVRLYSGLCLGMQVFAVFLF